MGTIGYLLKYGIYGVLFRAAVIGGLALGAVGAYNVLSSKGAVKQQGSSLEKVIEKDKARVEELLRKIDSKQPDVRY